MRTLWLYQTPLFSIRRTSKAIVEDYDDQARILCMMLTTAIPSGVLRLFCEMIGGDYEKVFDIGNTYNLDHKMHGDKPKKKKMTRKEFIATLSEEVVNYIKISRESRKELAEKFNIDDLRIIEYIRSPSRY